jgi:tetratricopeptide (TPR) repeat protein
MKSERRHELQHNALAEWLVKSAEEIKPYTNHIFAALVILCVAFLGYIWWSYESTSRSTLAWTELNAGIDSGNKGLLAKVIENYPNTDVANTATVALADFHLGDGCAGIFVNKATAQDDLKKAIDLYQSVRKQSHEHLLVERAVFGLARANEAKGDLQQAEKLYQETVSLKGTYATAASQRLADIQRPEIKKLYDDLARFDPKPAFSTQPGDRPTFDLNSLPGESSPEVSAPTFDLKLNDLDKK